MNIDWWDHQDKRHSREEKDESYPPINGCRMYEVGWTKVCIANLYPRLYSLLLANDLWRIVYKRPPEIAVE